MQRRKVWNHAGLIKCYGHDVCNITWQKCLRFLGLLLRPSLLFQKPPSAFAVHKVATVSSGSCSCPTVSNRPDTPCYHGQQPTRRLAAGIRLSLVICFLLRNPSDESCVEELLSMSHACLIHVDLPSRGQDSYVTSPEACHSLRMPESRRIRAEPGPGDHAAPLLHGCLSSMQAAPLLKNGKTRCLHPLILP